MGVRVVATEVSDGACSIVFADVHTAAVHKQSNKAWTVTLLHKDFSGNWHGRDDNPFNPLYALNNFERYQIQWNTHTQRELSANGSKNNSVRTLLARRYYEREGKMPDARYCDEIISLALYGHVKGNDD
eukprot:5355705-Amphidinium_carterae.1